MGILSTTIISVCVGLTPQQEQACEQGLIALTKQTTLEQEINKDENSLNKTLLKDAQGTLGNDRVTIIGGSLYILKSVSERHAKINIPTLGICNSAATDIGQDNYMIRLEWILK